MYRFSYELEIFVKQEFQHKGIGKCLLDRMVTLVDSGYHPRGGYDWLPREDYLRVGCTKMVKTMTVNYPHAHGSHETTKMENMTKFLKEFKFRKAGNLREFGYKMGKW